MFQLQFWSLLPFLLCSHGYHVSRRDSLQTFGQRNGTFLKRYFVSYCLLSVEAEFCLDSSVASQAEMMPPIFVCLFKCAVTNIIIACRKNNEFGICIIVLTTVFHCLCWGEEVEPGRTGHAAAAHTSSTKKTTQDGECRKETRWLEMSAPWVRFGESDAALINSDLSSDLKAAGLAARSKETINLTQIWFLTLRDVLWELNRSVCCSALQSRLKIPWNSGCISAAFGASRPPLCLRLSAEVSVWRR